MLVRQFSEHKCFQLFFETNFDLIESPVYRVQDVIKPLKLTQHVTIHTQDYGTFLEKKEKKMVCESNRRLLHTTYHDLVFYFWGGKTEVCHLSRVGSFRSVTVLSVPIFMELGENVLHDFMKNKSNFEADSSHAAIVSSESIHLSGSAATHHGGLHSHQSQQTKRKT